MYSWLLNPTIFPLEKSPLRTTNGDSFDVYFELDLCQHVAIRL